MTSGRHDSGFTYLGVILLVAAIGAGLAGIGEVWSTSRQREKEGELMWIGNQFRHAIGLYYQRTPGSTKRYPEKLEDLLQDQRYQTTQRYLRRIYADPLTGKAEWGVIAARGGGIMGVHSLSERRTVKHALVGAAEAAGATGGTHRDWRFVYVPPLAGVPR